MGKEMGVGYGKGDVSMRWGNSWGSRIQSEEEKEESGGDGSGNWGKWRWKGGHVGEHGELSNGRKDTEEKTGLNLCERSQEGKTSSNNNNNNNYYYYYYYYYYYSHYYYYYY